MIKKVGLDLKVFFQPKRFYKEQLYEPPAAATFRGNLREGKRAHRDHPELCVSLRGLMSNEQKEAVKGKVSRSNRETVLAGDFTGRFALQIQELPEVDGTCSGTP